MRYLALLLFATPLFAQNPGGVVYVAVDPTGSCGYPQPLQYNTANGDLSGCNAGTWATIGGGGSGTPGGATNSVQYKVNSSTFGGFTMSGDCTLVVSTGVITCT